MSHMVEIGWKPVNKKKLYDITPPLSLELMQLHKQKEIFVPHTILNIL